MHTSGRQNALRPRRLHRAVPVVGAILLAAGLSAAGTGAGAATARPAASSAVSAEVASRPAIPEGAAVTGPLAGAQPVRGDVGLKPADPAALASYAQAVSDPSSPSYRHYLGPGQFAAHFGPSPSVLREVTSALAAAGLSTSVSSNRLVVSFRGDASQAETAFRTTLSGYRLADGRRVFAPTTALSMPATVAPDVQTVVGLNDLATPQSQPEAGGDPGRLAARTPATAATAATATGPVACAAATEDAAQYGGLTDTQIADAYGVGGLYQHGDDGSGQTIAVYELEPFARSDIKTFDTCYFGASEATTMMGRLHVVNVDGGQQQGYGSGESELDIDDVSAVAPGATDRRVPGPQHLPGLRRQLQPDHRGRHRALPHLVVGQRL